MARHSRHSYRQSKNPLPACIVVLLLGLAVGGGMFYAVFLTQMKGGKQKLGKLDFDKAGAPLRRNGTKLQDDDATWGQEILNAPIRAAE
ncbi:unnamed protein product, partial [Heterosigma akashiwo]